ncbi:MAG: selenium-binding family protein, partial [Actinomycetota bacterium]|nr:selenium-binding family protein [Actinomycetota bacterium]
MAIWRPDPSFYPSPRMAMQAPREKLAYVAVLNPNAALNGDGNGRPD